MLLAIICDGMGGLSKGELASAAVVKAFSKWFDEELPYELENLDLNVVGGKWSLMLKDLNVKIIDYSHKRKISMGTTFTGVLFVKNEYVVVHVGDTRLYHIDNGLSQITFDSKEAMEYISSNKPILEKYNKLMKQYKALGISFIYSNIEDVTVPYTAPDILKRQKENKKAIITTPKLKDFKFCELQSAVVRHMKPLEFGDAYLLERTDISRIKVLEVK